MLNHELLRSQGILIIRPTAPLEAADFRQVAAEVDPYIEANGKLQGFLIDAQSFAGWSDLAALLAHFRFVRDHQKNIAKIAIVTDAKALEFSAGIAKHFVQAELRHFALSEENEAMQWLAGSTT